MAQYTQKLCPSPSNAEMNIAQFELWEVHEYAFRKITRDFQTIHTDQLRLFGMQPLLEIDF